MLDRMLKLEIPAAELIVRGIVVYLSVLLLLRVSGKRQVAQMGATEFVAILLISNAVQNAMNGGDNSLGAGLILATVLIALSALISYVTYKSHRLSALIEGTPTLLIHRGKIVRKHLLQEHLRESELKTLLRKQGVHDFHEVESAVLEADGSFSITRKSEIPPVYVDTPDSDCGI